MNSGVSKMEINIAASQQSLSKGINRKLSISRNITPTKNNI
jgi:hypothetical protein